MIVAINFSDDKYKSTQRLNSKTAKKFGANKIIEYSPNEIDDFFLKKNKEIFNIKKGYGLWIWKPYFIDKTLDTLNDGDYVIYTDSGSAYVNNINYLIDIMKRDNTDIMCFCIDQLERQWTKRDAFIVLNADKEEYVESNQICGTYIIVRKTDYAVGIIKKYLKYVQDKRIISDEKSVLGYPDYDGFIENRHDQSIWSLICKTNGIKPYRDPSEYGTKEKTDLSIFSKEVLERSTFPQIIESHRNPQIKYFFELNYNSKSKYMLLEKKIYNLVKKIRFKLCHR